MCHVRSTAVEHWWWWQAIHLLAARQDSSPDAHEARSRQTAGATLFRNPQITEETCFIVGPFYVATPLEIPWKSPLLLGRLLAEAVSICHIPQAAVATRSNVEPFGVATPWKSRESNLEAVRLMVELFSIATPLE